jgi:hypothetical protein
MLHVWRSDLVDPALSACGLDQRRGPAKARVFLSKAPALRRLGSAPLRPLRVQLADVPVAAAR